MGLDGLQGFLDVFDDVGVTFAGLTEVVPGAFFCEFEIHFDGVLLAFVESKLICERREEAFPERATPRNDWIWCAGFSLFLLV